jgi:hypothetical protein
MHVVAIPLVLISVLIGQMHAPSERLHSESRRGDQSCPTWFEQAPPLGPGRPEPVTVPGLSEMTVCRYHGPPGGIHIPGTESTKTNLAGERTIKRPHTVSSLARAFDRLLPYEHPGKETEFCPPESSGGFYVRFIYRDGRQSSVKVIPSGCRRAVAGKYGRPLFLPTYLERRLAKMVPPSHEAG